MKTERLNIWLDKKLKADFKKLCDNQMFDMSLVIRQHILKQVKGGKIVMD